MKNIGDEWIHPVCGTFSSLYRLSSFKTMDFVRNPEGKHEAVPEKRRTSKQQYSCEFCAGTINLLKCNFHSCGKYTHLYCLLKHKATPETEKGMIEEQEKWNLSLRLGDSKLHSRKKGRNITVYISKKLINDTFDSIKDALHDKLTLTLEPAKPKTHQKGAKEINEDSLLNKIVDRLEENTEFLAVDLNEDTRLIEFQREISLGKLTIECGQHISTNQYCICSNSKSDESGMIECDQCGNC